MPAVLSKFKLVIYEKDPFAHESSRIRGALNSQVGHWCNKTVKLKLPNNLKCLESLVNIALTS
jgi:hypothetical protein